MLTDKDPVESPTPEEGSLLHTDILLQPELLIGRRIKHRFEVDGDLVWYAGVVQQHNYVTSEFQVAYDGEEDLCWFTLLDDIRTASIMKALKCKTLGGIHMQSTAATELCTYNSVVYILRMRVRVPE